MPDEHGLAAVGSSIERYLNFAFSEVQPVEGRQTRALLARTEDLDPENHTENPVQPPTLTLYPYRVAINGTMRAAWSAIGHRSGRSHLPLDLHLLMTPWGDNAGDELRILGRTMQALDMVPTLTGPMLHPAEIWQPQDAIQLCLEEIATEDLMRTFDSLPVDYKLSVCYVARIIRIDSPVVQVDRTVFTAVAGPSGKLP